VDRRAFLAGTLGLLVAPLRVKAQSQRARIGLLGPSDEPRFTETAAGLTRGLRDQGYDPATVQLLRRRVSRGEMTEARAASETLVQERADVLFVIGSVLARLAREVAPALPIVFITPGDPVAGGLVVSLARPGRNMTGLTFEYPELSGKRLELLKELVPTIRRVLVLYDPRDTSPRQGVAAAREAAPRLGLSLVEREVRTPEDIARGLGGLADADALLEIPGGLPSGHGAAMIRAAHARRIPTIFHTWTETTKDTLVTYGVSDADTAQEAARLVAKILRGTNAGDLPVERPTKIRLVINLKTAKALGLTIPQSVLARADEVIE
jgi:putative tryptophan/tyrosine transport system substrate-binding protein